ncbi:uncharacterized protein [Porites lutea]|uniref:uncharacterized protein n=1 Tax=Porites lutea TaxID=51062 RepID=UPI003CC6BA22
MKFALLLEISFFTILQKGCGDTAVTCGRTRRTVSNKCCVFPFTYEGKQYDTCIWGGQSTSYWCATTDNFDRDEQWDICKGVKCYICTSDVSWSHCESYQQAHTCPHIYDECLKLSKEEENTYSSKLFRKRCTSNKLCTAYNPTCEGPDVVKCDFSCCMGDLCNAASYAQIERLGVLMVWVWVLFLYS